jgi:hypothetical protein
VTSRLEASSAVELRSISPLRSKGTHDIVIDEHAEPSNRRIRYPAKVSPILSGMGAY